jgi:hypothetical protein
MRRDEKGFVIKGCGYSRPVSGLSAVRRHTRKKSVRVPVMGILVLVRGKERVEVTARPII